jgi:Xaa-Pro aminopeptidase
MLARLNAFHARMEPNSVALIVSNPERTRSHDTEFQYRQASDMLYLNAFPEPHSMLVLCKLSGARKHSVVMFVQPKDRAREIWTGVRLGPEGAKADFLASEAYTNDQMEKLLTELMLKAQTVYYRFGINTELDEQFRKLWQPLQKPLRNPDDIVHELRLFKTGKELDLMRHACSISAEAHVEAMKSTRPGMREYQLQAVLEFMFKYHGASDSAYGSIVAGGNNAVILHYTSNRDTLKDGDLVLVDAGCEYMGYASDITRTWPVNGKFTEAQREIYQLVLDAEQAAIKCVRPGIPLARVHQTASRVMRRGLVKLGILPKSATAHAARKKNKNAEQPKPLQLTDFFMHGTSHWMGLDVHDVGKYMTGDGTRTDRGKGKRRKLERGMVFTVEPGLYFDAHDERVPAKYRGIGIRIEDDVLVTEHGCEVLTVAVPKSIRELEATIGTAS